MFKLKETAKLKMKSIKDAAWSYFKSDQLGPKNYKNVNEVIQDLEDGKQLKPLVCWSDGTISWGTDKVEVWINDVDQVNAIPKKLTTKINELHSETMHCCD